MGKEGVVKSLWHGVILGAGAAPCQQIAVWFVAPSRQDRAGPSVAARPLWGVFVRLASITKKYFVAL